MQFCFKHKVWIVDRHSSHVKPDSSSNSSLGGNCNPFRFLSFWQWSRCSNRPASLFASGIHDASQSDKLTPVSVRSSAAIAHPCHFSFHVLKSRVNFFVSKSGRQLFLKLYLSQRRSIMCRHLISATRHMFVCTTSTSKSVKSTFWFQGSCNHSIYSRRLQNQWSGRGCGSSLPLNA